jgi:hypothetical protein
MCSRQTTFSALSIDIFLIEARVVSVNQNSIEALKKVV